MSSGSPVTSILIFTAAMAFVLALCLYGLGVALAPAHGLLVAWFALITLVLHLWQEPAMARDPKGFARRFMAGLSIKMLLSLLVALVLLLRAPKEERFLIGVAFAGLYLGFLAFSTIRLTGLARKLPRS